MNHKIALNFEDGVTRFVNCQPEDRVADAAYRNGINIPLDCREGACGTCKAHCESGSFVMTDYVDDALTADEASRGYVLTCRMIPTSDCVVRIPVDSAASKAQVTVTRSARIAAIDRLSDTAFVLKLQGEDVASLDFLPGQYANLQLPGSEDSRAYSFSSLIKDGAVDFLIRNVPQGKMSHYLTELAQVGDEIHFQAPFGGFYLRAIERPILMIAGGTGLAPFLAMLEHIGRHEWGVLIHLVYGVTNDEDLVAVAELEAHVRALRGFFSYTACVVNTVTATRNKGFVTDYLLPEMFHGGEVDVYLCGPPPMVGAVETFMAARKLAPAHMYYEKFLPGR